MFNKLFLLALCFCFPLFADAPEAESQEVKSELAADLSEEANEVAIEVGIAAAAQVIPANMVIVPENSVETFEWVLKFISSANHSIELSPCYSAGSVLQRLLDTIEKRMEEMNELKVHFILSPILLYQEDRDRLELLTEKYPDRFHLAFTPAVFEYFPDYSMIENHFKCVIVDEHYFSLGGTNFDVMSLASGLEQRERPADIELVRATLASGARDQDIVGCGPIAKQVRKSFYSFFALWESYVESGGQFIKDPSMFDHESEFFALDDGHKPFCTEFETSPLRITIPAHEMKFILSGPMDDVNPIAKAYAELIDGAEKEIYISNMYFYPCELIFSALKRAVTRGVAVHLTTNGIWDQAPSCNGIFGWASRISYVPLFYGRDFHFWERNVAAHSKLGEVTIYEYRVPDIIYHKKVMVIDGKKAVVGSYNLGSKSNRSDYETIFVMNSPKVAHEVLQVIATDRAHSCPIDPADAALWYFDPIIAYQAAVQQQIHGFL